MKVISTELPGVVVIEPDVYKDDRGFFLESYNERKFVELGITGRFVQDNHSRSVRNTLRGLHAQLKQPQGKLVRATMGEVFDVAVDIRRGSPTFGKWFGATLSAENFRMMYVPPGYAHGFCVVSEIAEFQYKCTNFYDPTSELSLRWDDPAFAIQWPIAAPLLSRKDQSAPALAQLMDQLPHFTGLS